MTERHTDIPPSRGWRIIVGSALCWCAILLGIIVTSGCAYTVINVVNCDVEAGGQAQPGAASIAPQGSVRARVVCPQGPTVEAVAEGGL